MISDSHLNIIQLITA